MNASTLHKYSTEVLSFAFVGQDAPAHPAASDAAESTKDFERFRRIFDKSSAKTIILFGLGNGVLADKLAASLKEDERLLVCDLNPAKARVLHDAGRLAWWREDVENASLLVDTSLWAILYLLCQSNVTKLDTTMVLNPDADGDEKTKLKELQRTLLQGKHKSAINGTPFGHFAVQAPALTVACILSPAEPDLRHFLGQFPDWVEELIILWDGDEVPELDVNISAATECPVRQLAHPLGDNFAAQRNRLLAECPEGWVLMLDGDEAFSDDMWTMLPALFPLRDIDGYWFQRQTFYPDAENYRMGYGLWPDLQLRLFKNQPGLAFEGAIHERLTGIPGRVALVLDAPIQHNTFVSKRPEEIKAKLEKFNTASSGTIGHTLSEEYPHLPCSMLHQSHLLWNEFQLLILPAASD